MPVTADQPAPYAPASAMLSLIERHRNKGLPPVVDSDVLGRAGISSSLIPRTLRSMRALGLLDDDGRPTPTFEGIRLSPEPEYQQRLKEWLFEAYAEALVYVDPTTATETSIRDAFRSYKPVGQQPRMVSLFQGLVSAAGLAPEKDLNTPTRRVFRVPAKKLKLPTPQKPTSVAAFSQQRRPPAYQAPNGNLPPALAGLLESLPSASVGWSRERRDQFVATFGAVIDFCIPIDTPSSQEGGDSYATDNTAVV